MDYSQWYRDSKKVTIDIEFNNKIRTLPVNPEDLTIKRSASNNNINIIGLGQVTRKGQPGLITMEIKSFFPSPISPFFIYDVTPEDYINFIYEIWETENTNNKVAKLVTRGLDKNFSMWFVIDNFDYEYKGGDFDISYSLSIKEYVPYGAKVINIQNEGMGNNRPVSTAEEATITNKTYTVSSGDSLWAIAKKCTGNGDNWKQIYDLNKDIVGTNPNYLKVGSTLVLPNDWKIPERVTNPTSKSTKKQETLKVELPKTEATTTTTTTQQPIYTTEMTLKPIVNNGRGSGDDTLTFKNTQNINDEIALQQAKNSTWLLQPISLYDNVVRDLEKAKSRSNDLKEIQKLNEAIVLNSKIKRSYEQALSSGWKDVGVNKKTGNIIWYKDASGKKYTL